MADGMNTLPMETMPSDRRDGRVMLIRHGHRPWTRRARFWPDHQGGGCWIDEVTGGQLLNVTGWADAP
ncbi:hypothetical protein SAMN06295920_103186 [Rhizorhabdus histidinilytica]|uniref:Uncharacterized protein n=1 Tax=Rhizorhabdus histidinilytica TaxID=439228 RepID=A0A1T5BQA8_9SPHN|nr:hypothetical protein SAMN06295920_103186 [Rhizorhabdus histidinilytica]